MQYRLGATNDGKIRAVDGVILIDGGAYASFGLVTTYYSGQLLTAPYAFGSYRFDSTRVYTNKPPCGPKRGHGSVQPRFGFEVQLDKLSDRLNIDPIELRRRNFLGSNTRTINELRVTSNGFMACLDAVERASDWKNKWRRLPHGRGVGVAGSCYISGTNYPIYPNAMPQAGIQIGVERSGRVTVLTGASEIGQGSDSVVAEIAAEELGVPLEYVRVHATDSDMTPVDLGAYSSRETFMVGNACLMAATDLRGRRMPISTLRSRSCAQPSSTATVQVGRARRSRSVRRPSTRSADVQRSLQKRSSAAPPETSRSARRASANAGRISISGRPAACAWASSGGFSAPRRRPQARANGCTKCSHAMVAR
jgi:CO/xanthine dehydrogenase Mo-binding subunit